METQKADNNHYEHITDVVKYHTDNFQNALEDLKTLARIPSISLAGFDPQELEKSAQATADLFKKAGLENVELLRLSDEVHPYVYGEWIHQPDAPTFLLYAHHDVQPIGREEKWDFPAFEPTEQNGRLYGRGTADDKAGIIIHTASIESFLKTHGKLPINIKVLIEGEEEIGSQNLGAFLEKYKDKLQADGMILTDCANIDSGIPCITTSLRGLVAIDINLEALTHPVHSGLWGGILPEVNLAMSQVLSSLCDLKGNILVPGLMENIAPLSASEKEAYQKLQLEKISRLATGMVPEAKFTVPEHEFAERLWRMPHLSVNVIESGSKKLVSNIVQDSSWARISVRIAPNQDPQDIADKLKRHIESVCPKGFKLTLRVDAEGNWWKLQDLDHPAYAIAANSLSKAYGQQTQFIGCGASIPFVQPLTSALGDIPAILVGVEDPYTNAHAENESLLLSDFQKAILGQIYMFSDLAHVHLK